MAVNLIDYAKQSKDPLQKGFIMDLLRYSDLLNVVPFETVDGLQVSGTRWQTLPGAAFRKIGAGYTESTGNTEQVEETLVALGGDVKIDNFLTGNANVVQDPLTTQMNMKAKAVAFAFNNAFINGDQGVDPDTFEGLKKRVSNMPTRMTIWLDSNANGTGTTLDVLASTTNEHKFLDAIHRARKFVDGATHILCNETSWIGLGQTARRLNLFQLIEDALGRTWEAIGPTPFIDVGLKADKTTEIIPTNEAPNADSTSIYVVRMDMDDGLHGITLAGHELDVYDPLTGGEMESGPQKLRRIDWGVGLFNLSQFVICRIAGFKFV